jgi:hypothetical protein
MSRILLTTLLLALLAGCDKPPPDPEAPPEPQAEATELRDAIQEPIDKAKAFEATDAEREAERQKSLEEIGG